MTYPEIPVSFYFQREGWKFELILSTPMMSVSICWRAFELWGMSFRSGVSFYWGKDKWGERTNRWEFVRRTNLIDALEHDHEALPRN